MLRTLPLLLAALVLVAPPAGAAPAVKVPPRFSFDTRVAAQAWGVRVAGLNLRYKSKNPGIAAAARKEISTMAAAFQAKYKKQWSAAEKQKRLATFTENLWKIGEINRNSKKTGWWAAQTAYADLSSAEFAKRYLMNNVKEPKPFTGVTNIPDHVLQGNEVDWDARNKLTPVRNQYNCGSCWAMSAAAALESRYLIKKGLLASKTNIQLSVQQLVDCVRSPRKDISGAPYTSAGCDGGWSDQALDFVRQWNLTMEEFYPYTGVGGTCKLRVLDGRNPAKALKQALPDPGWFQVTSRNVTAMRQAVEYTPIVFYMRAEADFHLYSGGIYSTECTKTKLNHAMLIYGYKLPVLSTGTPVWLVKNSWGTDWGDNGHAQIKMDLSSSGSGLCRMHEFSYMPNDVSFFLPAEPLLSPLPALSPIKPSSPSPARPSPLPVISPIKPLPTISPLPPIRPTSPTPVLPISPLPPLRSPLPQISPIKPVIPIKPILRRK